MSSNRFVLRFLGDGKKPDADVELIRSRPEIKILDETSRSLLIELNVEEAINIPNWKLTPEVFTPLPDTKVHIDRSYPHSNDELTQEFIYTLIMGLSKEDFKEAEKRLEAANKKFLDYLHTFREDISPKDPVLVWNEDEQERKFNQGLDDANGTND